MKIIDMTEWPEADRAAVHAAWEAGHGFGVGPMPPETLDAMLADGVLDHASPIPGMAFVAYRYQDAAGASLRVMLTPADDA